MKKILIFATFAVAIAALASCDQERYIENETNVSDGSLVFKMQGVTTKASDDLTRFAGKRTLSIAKETEDGEAFYLEETLGSLDEMYAPETKGTPAYTMNVGSLYGAFNAVAYDGNKAKLTSEADVPYSYITDKGIWRYQYDSDIWAKAQPLHFFMRMPADYIDANVGSTYAPNPNNGSVTFTYTSPANSNGVKDAVSQKDMLFAYRSLTEAQYSTYSGGAPVLFYHALTGVKFRIGNEQSDGTKTYITKVTFTGLKDTGTCTVTPVAEGTSSTTPGEVDDPSYYSSASAVSWNNVGFSSTGVQFSQEYSESTIVDYGNVTNKKFPNSFYNDAIGTDYNLNDENATMTFWFIPQDMTNDVKVTVEFHVSIKDKTGAWKAGETKTLSFDLGKAINAKAGKTVKWNAGEIRTYSLAPKDVDIHIEDKIDTYTKSDVVIVNTGNVDAYVRCTIVANWVRDAQDEDGNPMKEIVVGYTSEDPSSSETWQPWKLNAQGNAANYGTFTGLPGSGWVYQDGYYYYQNVIGPGGSPYTDLFTKYVVSGSPVMYLPSEENILVREAVEGIHLVMYIAVQAINAYDQDGTAYGSWSAAWAATDEAFASYNTTQQP